VIDIFPGKLLEKKMGDGVQLNWPIIFIVDGPGPGQCSFKIPED
jgi:hypothetical protein